MLYAYPTRFIGTALVPTLSILSEFVCYHHRTVAAIVYQPTVISKTGLGTVVAVLINIEWVIYANPNRCSVAQELTRDPKI